MSEVIVLVEGKTEQDFIQALLVPHLAFKGVYLTPIQLSKPGKKGGDVRFDRAKNDIRLHLRQREDTFVTLMVDFYGIAEWPGYDDVKLKNGSKEKSKAFCENTTDAVNELFEGENYRSERFIPYVSMHEFEALLFSDIPVLAKELGAHLSSFDEISQLNPEEINQSPDTAPSKRLEQATKGYHKIAKGVAIAKAIGLAKMREQCPLFNDWVSSLEKLAIFDSNEEMK
jgi:hypothetical protein